MNSLKKISFLVTILISFFVININVFAEDTCNNYACAECSYDLPYDVKAIFELKSDGNCNVNLNFRYETPNHSDNSVVELNHNLVPANFVSKESNKIVCPATIFNITNGGGTGMVIKYHYDITSTKIEKTIGSGSTKAKVSSKEVKLSNSSNNGKVIGESCNTLSCSKEVTLVGSSKKIMVTVQVVNGEVKYSFNDPNTHLGEKSSLKASDFENGCPNYYVTCAGNGSYNTCNFSMTNDFDVRDYDATKSNEDTEIGECGIGFKKNSDTGACDVCADGFYKSGLDCVRECPKNFSPDENGNCKENNSYVAEDPCGDNSVKQVLRFFGYLLLIAKVVVPLIIIGFGTFDLFKAVIDKDEKSIWKQLKAFGIRIFTGMFIFFIPGLVYALFGFSEKLNFIEQDKYKTCATCLLKPNLCDVKLDKDK